MRGGCTPSPKRENQDDIRNHEDADYCSQVNFSSLFVSILLVVVRGSLFVRSFEGSIL
eukprot:m.99800 g.99800  ORF g.99800 m.99800 type:complete len:58 (-) comp9033_c2_seq1:394-567(-)